MTQTSTKHNNDLNIETDQREYTAGWTPSRTNKGTSPYFRRKSTTLRGHSVAEVRFGPVL